MKAKTFCIFAAIGMASASTSALAEVVTPEQVLALPVGTKYKISNHSDFLVRTQAGFDFYSAEEHVPVACNNVGKAGGRGNATINCTRDDKFELRFEWIDMQSLKAQGWKNLAAKSGQTQHNKPELEGVMIRQ